MSEDEMKDTSAVEGTRDAQAIDGELASFGNDEFHAGCSDDWDEPDWDWDAEDPAGGMFPENYEDDALPIDAETNVDGESKKHVFEGPSFLVAIADDILPFDFEIVSDNDGEGFWVEASSATEKSQVVLFQMAYQAEELSHESIGDLSSLLETHGIPEAYWGIYWSSAYSSPAAGLPITRWTPSWDAEAQCSNGSCFLAQRTTGIGVEILVWPYSHDNADHLHIFVPRNSLLDKAQTKDIALSIASSIELKGEAENRINDFLKDAATQKADSAEFINVTEALTSIFITLQAIVVEACLSRAANVDIEEIDTERLEACFDGIGKLHLRAAKYLSRLLDAYESQVMFGATVSERSEILSYIGAFDGNMLPGEISSGQEQFIGVAELQTLEELLELRSRLERCRSALRNNPNGIVKAGDADAEESGGKVDWGAATRFSVGNEFCLGRYYWTDENDLQPIEWRIIDIKGSHALCVSKNLVDCLYFNEFDGDVTWETSTIRDWLNDDFADIAFSPNDRNRISGAKLENESNQEFGTSGGNTTRDRIFLLSASEATRFLDAEEDSPQPSSYAESKGANQWWWLRSPGHKESYIAYVSAEGKINSAGTKASLLARAIRPAFYLKLSACEGLAMNWGDGVEND